MVSPLSLWNVSATQARDSASWVFNDSSALIFASSPENLLFLAAKGVALTAMLNCKMRAVSDPVAAWALPLILKGLVGCVDALGDRMLFIIIKLSLNDR